VTTSDLFVDGRPLKLGKRIGKGGEGEVFSLADRPDEAVKVYTSPDSRREAKIVAMVAAGLAEQHNLIAFPLTVVRRRSGRFAGFTMRLVKSHTPLFELYSPGARKIAFVKADYRFLVHTAANVAVAIAQAHRAGAVIGDINHSGILVSDAAMAALIDADSFQFSSAHTCRVGVPEYTPPELQGRSLDGLVRTPTHDAFGLAVVVFQLLFMGRHPFSGRYSGGEMPIERAIAEHRFAYSSNNGSRMTPPPGAARLTDFPDEIRTMFEAAFGRNPTARPEPTHWAAALKRLGATLSKCQAHSMHFYPSAAGACLWCRMERELGIVLFVPALPAGAPVGTVSDPAAAGFDLRSVWGAIQAVRLPSTNDLMPVTLPVSLEASADARALIGARRSRRLGGLAVLVAAAALLGWNQALWLICAPLAFWGYTLVWGPGPGTQAFVDRYRRAHEAHRVAIDDWRARVGIPEFFRRRSELDEARAAYERLPGDEARQLADLASKRRSLHLRRHLASFPLRRASIRGIGPSKIATLASYGIDTAAEVDRHRILAIPGFGPTNSQPLLDWRTRAEARFVYNPNATSQDRQEEERVRLERAAKAVQLRRTLLAGEADLRAGLAAIEQRLKVPDPVIDRSYTEREQAAADLRALGVVLPAPAPARAMTVRPSSPSVNGGSPGAGNGTVAAALRDCPLCGGSMTRRVARKGARAGQPFLGCVRYPACKGTRAL
jgi:DNA-binding helix-hairpin-helix protein with protein kinase domain